MKYPLSERCEINAAITLYPGSSATPESAGAKAHVKSVAFELRRSILVKSKGSMAIGVRS